MIKSIAQIALFCFLLTACIPNESSFKGYTKVQIQKLLATDSIKIWNLESRLVNGEAVIFDDCELTSELQFKFTANAKDKDSVLYINQADTCYAINDTLFGFWYVPSSIDKYDLTDTLALVWNNEDTGYFLIDEINPEMLQIRSLSTDSLKEYFTAKELISESISE